MENEQDVELEPQEKTEEESEAATEPVKQEKQPLTLEQRRGILKRQLSKIEKELGVVEEKPVVEKKQEGFDYAQKAFLKVNDVAPDEYDFVQEVMRDTGKSLDDVLASKWFQAELKERRDLKASKDAIPSGSKRSATPARDSVEYWLAKGGLPPVDQFELRTKVLNARIKREETKSQFSDNPIV